MSIGVNNIEEEYRKIVVLRLDSLMYGILGAYIFVKNQREWANHKNVVFIVGMLLIVAMKANSHLKIVDIYEPIFYNLESIAVLCLIPFFSALKKTSIQSIDAFFVQVSTLSYSMYLLNLAPVIHHLLPLTNRLLGYKGQPNETTYVHNYILFWVYTLVGSYLLYHLYEKRMTALRDKVKSYPSAL